MKFVQKNIKLYFTRCLTIYLFIKLRIAMLLPPSTYPHFSQLFTWYYQRFSVR